MGKEPPCLLFFYIITRIYIFYPYNQINQKKNTACRRAMFFIRQLLMTKLLTTFFLPENDLVNLEVAQALTNSVSWLPKRPSGRFFIVKESI